MIQDYSFFLVFFSFCIGRGDYFGHMGLITRTDTYKKKSPHKNIKKINENRVIKISGRDWKISVFQNTISGNGDHVGGFPETDRNVFTYYQDCRCLERHSHKSDPISAINKMLNTSFT